MPTAAPARPSTWGSAPDRQPSTAARNTIATIARSTTLMGRSTRGLWRPRRRRAMIASADQARCACVVDRGPSPTRRGPLQTIEGAPVPMPWHHRLDVLRAILDDGAVPTFVAPDPETAFAFVAGCRDGGARVVEFTNRGEFAYATFADLARRVSRELPDVILGAGTIIDAPTAALFIAAGASFIVGQSLSADVARLCNRRRIAYIPGAGSATEIADAEELGCEIVKLFPAAAFDLSLIHISEPTRLGMISYAVFCLKKKKQKNTIK